MVLEGAIGRGEAGEQAIAEAADILDDPTRARLRDMLDARRAGDAARDRRIETVSAVLAGRAPATGPGSALSGQQRIAPAINPILTVAVGQSVPWREQGGGPDRRPAGPEPNGAGP
ncbi:MAG: hypothetical protein ACE1Y3_03505, partial [Rhodospirillales bacterium]